MKKFYFFALIFIGLFAFSGNASANNYVLNDSNVDQLFAAATEVSLVDITSAGVAGAMDIATNNAVVADKSATVAAILAFFLGGYAIHRYYLGTSGGMFFYYCCTLGGIFGVVPIVDFVMLLTADNISKYCNNEKFIMW